MAISSSNPLSSPAKTPSPGDSYVQSFARGLQVIRSFSADAPQQTLTQVAGRSELTRAGARRILLTLQSLDATHADRCARAARQGTSHPQARLVTGQSGTGRRAGVTRCASDQSGRTHRGGTQHQRPSQPHQRQDHARQHVASTAGCGQDYFKAAGCETRLILLWR